MRATKECLRALEVGRDMSPNIQERKVGPSCGAYPVPAAALQSHMKAFEIVVVPVVWFVVLVLTRP